MKKLILIGFVGINGIVFSQEKEHLNGTSISENESNEIEKVLETKQALEISIYPNPSQGAFVIEGNSGASVVIYSAAGTYVGTWEIGPEGKLSIEDLPQGSFVCSIIEGEKRSVKKLVVL